MAEKRLIEKIKDVRVTAYYAEHVALPVSPTADKYDPRPTADPRLEMSATVRDGEDLGDVMDHMYYMVRAMVKLDVAHQVAGRTDYEEVVDRAAHAETQERLREVRAEAAAGNPYQAHESTGTEKGTTSPPEVTTIPDVKIWFGTHGPQGDKPGMMVSELDLGTLEYHRKSGKFYHQGNPESKTFKPDDLLAVQLFKAVNYHYEKKKGAK